METIQFGTRQKAIGVLRSNVADGCKGFAILIDVNPKYKDIAYDEKIKRAVEVDQDAVIKYRLNPRGIYLFLVARLNTDMMGNIVGEEVVMEYVQLSDGLYTEYTEGVKAVGKCNAMMLTKIKKSGPNGEDYSYTKIQGANVEVTDALRAKIKELRVSKELQAALWDMVDSATSMKLPDFEKLLKEKEDLRAVLVGQKASVMISSGNKVVESQLKAAVKAVDPVPKAAVKVDTAIKEAVKADTVSKAKDDFGVEAPTLDESKVKPEPKKDDDFSAVDDF